MNTRSRKALSPVVASIILIAVTVAVSIAVAAWMGALSFNFMNTEQISITYADFDQAGQITLTVTNSGSTDVSINLATVNGHAATLGTNPTPILANSAGTLVVVTYVWLPSETETIKLTSTKGNSFPYTVVTPSA